jgi:2-C-methyl-D-erythritol 4-phosphate cytidylyltransferase
MNIKQWILYKIYNFKNNINYKKNILDLKIPQINIGLLLSAGTSSRFNTKKPKQLFTIDDKPILLHSIQSFINVVDKLIIVTNTQCYDEIKEMTKNYYKIFILINDINSRTESIKKGLSYLQLTYNNINNIIIHDSARPFINETHFKTLLKSNETFQYSQYYLKLVNGLLKKNNEIYDVKDRDKYIEICTPLCCNYKLYYFIFMNYIGNSNPFTSELIPILNLMNIKCNFIEGYYNSLRKITYIEDIM